MKTDTENRPILIADRRILSIPIKDNQEEMVDLSKQNEIVYGPSPEIPDNADYIFIRKTVYEKLKQAQKLLPQGLRFCLYEGYRSLQLQKTLFDNRFVKIKAAHPDWTHAELFAETIKMVSPVINLDGSDNIPPHSTGGAVDVYLIDEKNNAIDMGIHPQNWMEDDGSISETTSQKISKEAQHHRSMMSKVLTSVGFVKWR